MKKRKQIVIVFLLIITLAITYIISPATESPSTVFINSKVENKTLQKENITPAKTLQTAQIQPIEASQSVNQNYLTRLLDGCSKTDTSNDIAAQINNQQSDYLGFIEKSAVGDDKLALMIQSAPDNEKFDFEYLLSIKPSIQNAAIHYERLLLQCNQNFDVNFCNDALYSQAIVVDKDNAYLLHLVAAIHFSQNKPNKALAVIKLANEKPYFNNYYFEMIKFIEQNYKNNSALNFNERLTSAIGIAAAKFGASYAPLVKFCKNNQNNIEIADTCLQAAFQLENNSKTALSSLIGLAIQEANYKHNFNTDLAEQVHQKRKDYEDSYTNNSNYHTMSTLMVADEKLGRAWLNSGLAKGEKFANEQAIEELEILAKNENYRPCK